MPLPEGPRIAVMLPRGTTRSMSDRIVRAPRSRRTPERRTAGTFDAGAAWGMGGCRELRTGKRESLAGSG
ncbi:hypothetical protein GCM10011394_27490 [Luteimonas terricola]|uniref:Uncharacterized protein n=1 Tax=Luteimonas terricola TaxID=645597 RepID=A0ABQ2EMM2_9GAMM|nr:hypothetical protein GCM10011394_27490 [Luteimonas terricola]